MPCLSPQHLSVSLEVMSVVVRVQCYGAFGGAVADHLRAAWASCLTDDQSEPAVILRAVLDPDLTVVRAATAAGAVAHVDAEVMEDWLTPHITRSVIDHLAGQVLMLHACVLANPVTGAAAVLVGPSGAGKTTMALKLAHDLAYVTDETAAIETDLHIRPFLKPLSLHRDTISLKEQKAPGSLGLKTWHSGAPYAAAVVLLDRRPEQHGGATLTPVPLLEGLALIAEHTSHLRRHEAPLHRLASLLSRCGGLRRLTYRSAADAESAVRELVGAA